MKQLILLAFCIFLGYTNAQTDLSNGKSFDELIASYSEFIYKDPATALKYAIQAKSVAKINDEQKAKAFYCISKCYNELHKNKNALQHIESALSNSTLFKNELLLYKCFFLKGAILNELGEDSKALVAYLKAMEYTEGLGIIYKVSLLSNIAHIKKLHKDFEEAIRLYKEVLKHLETIGVNANNKVYKLIAFLNIADSYLWIENPDEAELYNEAGLTNSSDKEFSWLYYPLLMNKAIIHYQRAQYNECISLSKQLRDNTLDGDNEGLYLTSLCYLGKSFYALNQYQESIQYLEKALKFTKVSENVNINEKELHEFLALDYNKTGNSEKAAFHFERYSALEKKQSAEDLKINNETHQLIDIAPLHTEINTLGKKLNSQSKNKKWLFITAIASFALFIGSIVYYKLREKRTKEKFEELLKKVATLEEKKKKIASKKEKILDNKAKVILDRIADFEKKEYYLLVECSLSFMAEKLETNTSYLSKTINTYKGKSYTTYITELRIDAALIKLKNSKTLQSYNMTAIAAAFGFKRQETFSKAFKAHTGIYPSQFLKNLTKNS